MSVIDTLFVTASHRGMNILTDTIGSLKWASTGECMVVAVDASKRVPDRIDKPVVDNGHVVISSPIVDDVSLMYHALAGIRYAVNLGVVFKHVCLISDRCLMINQGADSFFLDVYKDGIGLIGIKTTLGNMEQWRDGQAYLFSLGLPTTSWENPPPSINSDIMFLTPAMVEAMISKDLLDCTKYTHDTAGRVSFGSFMSWVAHLCGLHVVLWGTEYKALPPLYYYPSYGEGLTAPHLLHDQIKVFGPIGGVFGYSEAELRSMYAQVRGDRTYDRPLYRPVVSGPGDADL